jgi:signal transduction histidine kinase
MVLEALQAMGSYFRGIFATPAGRETGRAFLVFGLALLFLTAIACQLAFREVSVKALSNRLDQIRHEAENIAEAVVRIGGSSGNIDFSRVRQNSETLKNFITERLTRRYVIHYVEVVDRFGVRQLLVPGRSPFVGPVRELPGNLVPVDWPESGQQVFSVPLGRAEGEVRVGVHSATVLQELERIRRSLRLKVGIAAAMALAVLVGGFFYVLYLIRKNRRLEQARQSAERASYVGLLASNLAHEIRNPLNAMNINLQMLDEEFRDNPDLVDVDWAELLDQTKTEISRLESLVKNFLSFARPAEPRFESEDLNAILRDVVLFLEGDFRQSSVELVTALEPLLPRVDVDSTQLRQAFLNLLSNAHQVMRGGGRVTVRTRAGAAGEVVVEIEDDGPGMTPEVQERAFEVFYSRRGGGTGLGLPIAKQIVERHGGRIELESTEGKGTLFRIRLPRRHEHMAEAPEGAAG